MRGSVRVIIGGAVVLGGAVAWYVLSPLFIDRVVSEAAVAGEVSPVAAGTFTKIDRLHWAEGTATIYEKTGGGFALRFEEGFNAANGPDLRVVLSPHASPRDHDELGEYVELAELKGNIGSQNYDIPSDVDLATIQSVVIYCKRFGVLFSTATLADI
jgi:hypothetical protein